MEILSRLLYKAELCKALAICLLLLPAAFSASLQLVPSTAPLLFTQSPSLPNEISLSREGLALAGSTPLSHSVSSPSSSSHSVLVQACINCCSSLAATLELLVVVQPRFLSVKLLLLLLLQVGVASGCYSSSSSCYSTVQSFPELFVAFRWYCPSSLSCCPTIQGVPELPIACRCRCSSFPRSSWSISHASPLEAAATSTSS
ncbi:hypothetical protein CRG98_041627 [Punica granatum]|uniref:Uncharacterized protein n=1 Tax=Punica granatum TaxID=22663 RepID=A0A2I0I1Y8_PUNGR|nr:hypothetical protein CRG98_041627 [Punica granatum]